MLQRTCVWWENLFKNFLVSDEWREALVWNCSCVNTWKGTVLHRKFPRHRVNGKPIRTYAERFHVQPVRSSRVDTALLTDGFFKTAKVLH